MKCTKCKAELRIAQEQIGVNEQNYPIMKTFAYCDKCRTKYDYDQLLRNQPKPNSALSVWALILSLLGCTSPIGGLLGIIDLCINDKSKKHIGSWFAIIFSVLFLITGGSIISCSGSVGETEDTVVEVNSEIVLNDNVTENSEEIKEETQNYYTQGQSFETDNNLKITINSVNLDYNEYEDEYGWYAPEDGMKYVSVSFTYENIGNSDAYASIYDYNCYADGTLMQQTYYFGGDFINDNLSAGRNLSFETFYVVPIDAQEIELEYNALISWSDEKIIIKLQ